MDPDGTVTEAAGDLWFPNGSVITPDGVLIVNETLGNRCTAFDLTADGQLVNRRVWAQFGPLLSGTTEAEVFGQIKVAPDGACLDAEGALWIADAIGGRLLRVKEGGEIADELRPGSGVFACALGGADGRTLYACVAPDFNEAARTGGAGGEPRRLPRRGAGGLAQGRRPAAGRHAPARLAGPPCRGTAARYRSMTVSATSGAAPRTPETAAAPAPSAASRTLSAK